MSNTLSATLVSNFSLVETISTSVPFVSTADQTMTHAINNSEAIDGSTTPSVAKVAFVQVTQGAGNEIDLTAMTGTNGATVTFNTLKIVAMKVRNPATNTNTITIAKGAANGYTGFGSAFSVTVPVGGHYTFYNKSGGVAVDGTHKTFDITAAQAGEKLDVILCG